MKTDELLRGLSLSAGLLACMGAYGAPTKKPNVVFVFADQWRAQDLGCIKGANVKTPNIDKLASEGLMFTNAVSSMPVSSPYRASLLTGQYALTHGVFINDVPLDPAANTMGKSFKQAGYHTAYIGKWHVDGHGRTNYIPPERRQGFDYFKALECTHSYNRSQYYDNDDPKVKMWEGYDAIAQTEDAISYITARHDDNQPFALFLSWGPPHDPYERVPQQYLDMYPPSAVKMRPNVPEESRDKAYRDLQGYYAHITALDDCVGKLQSCIRNLGMDEHTIFVFTSDHGDMLHSQGMVRKQKPYEESAVIPFILKYPDMFGVKGRKISTPLGTPDIMPTLLSMCHIEIPSTVEGDNLSPILTGKKKDDIEGVLIECVMPFSEWNLNNGGREYRAVRTKRYTYVRDLEGAWLLYDNQKDPYQLNNLANQKKVAKTQRKLDDLLNRLLAERGDKFLPGYDYVRQHGYDAYITPQGIYK